MELDFLDKMGKQFSALVISPTETLNSLLQNIVKHFSDKKIPGLFVSFNRPYSSVISELQKNKINTKNLFFIDCVKKGVYKVPKEVTNVFSIDTPADLTSLSITISEFAKNIPGEKFLAIDTLSTLLIYNNENLVVKFVKSLTEKTAGCGLKTVVLTQKENDLVEKISLFFDKTVNMSLLG